METEGTFPCSQEPATGFYPKPAESSQLLQHPALLRPIFYYTVTQA
jgi:hypothetical protein